MKMEMAIDNGWKDNETDSVITLYLGEVPLFGIGLNLHCFGIALFGIIININWRKE